MACKQLSKFENSKIVAYNDCGLSLPDIAKKLNHHHSPIDIFLKNKKTGNNHPPKNGYDHKRKSTASENRKIIWATKLQSQNFQK